MFLILVLVVLFLVFGGGYYGMHSGMYSSRGFGGGIGLILLVLVLFWIFGAFGRGGGW